MPDDTTGTIMIDALAAFTEAMHYIEQGSLCFSVRKGGVEIKADYEVKCKVRAGRPNRRVGTVTERDERFRRFCAAHKKGVQCDPNCPAHPPGNHFCLSECRDNWGRLPYEEGGEK